MQVRRGQENGTWECCCFTSQTILLRVKSIKARVEEKYEKEVEGGDEDLVNDGEKVKIRI